MVQSSQTKIMKGRLPQACRVVKIKGTELQVLVAQAQLNCPESKLLESVGIASLRVFFPLQLLVEKSIPIVSFLLVKIRVDDFGAKEG